MMAPVFSGGGANPGFRAVCAGSSTMLVRSRAARNALSEVEVMVPISWETGLPPVFKGMVGQVTTKILEKLTSVTSQIDSELPDHIIAAKQRKCHVLPRYKQLSKRR